VINGLYLSAAGALMESARHSVISNNIANINTVGFRDDLVVVRARDAQALEDASAGAYATPMDALGGGLLLSETYTRPVQGPINITDNPLDFAIDGEGYFAVTDGEQVFYTRAGEFNRDATGRLATPDGRYFLADDSGRPLLMPLEGKLAVANDGTVTVNGATAGKIDVFRFADERSLAKMGANLYRASGVTPSTAGTGQIKQGALEMSTVSPAAELANMILAQRGYELNMQLIRMQDQSLGDLIALGRPSM
jgi:flagellar basal body rod protein FlgG